VDAVGGWVYISDSKALYAMYAPDPTHPSAGGYVNGACGRVKVANGYAYVAWDLLSHPNGGLEVLTESDPTHPVFGYWNTDGQSEDLALANGYIYLADGDAGLVIFPQAAPSAISGQVRVRGTTTNIQGAIVEASIGGAVKGSTTTGADGMYLIPGLRPGSYSVTARKQGYVSETNEVVVGVGQTANANFNLDLTSITGQVREAGTGTNIAGATVFAYQGGVVKGTATTDAGGIYAIGGLSSGTYVVAASKSGYVTQTKANMGVTEGQTTYVNFNLTASGTLMGQVVEKGTTTALVGATVKAYQGAVLAASTTTASNGVYTINCDLPTGSNYVVTASKTGYVPQTKAKISVTGGQTTYVNFNLDRVSLMGQVRQFGTTTDLAGATVAAYLGSATTPSATATTDANGIYQIGGLSSGTYTVVASDTGYVKQIKPGISFTEGTITYVNFNLQVSGKLKGQVTDKLTSAPIIGATVIARSGGILWATATTVGPWGIYEINSDLPAGTFVMQASAPGYVAFGRNNIAVSAGATTYVNFFLQSQ